MFWCSDDGGINESDVRTWIATVKAQGYSFYLELGGLFGGIAAATVALTLCAIGKRLPPPIGEILERVGDWTFYLGIPPLLIAICGAAASFFLGMVERWYRSKLEELLGRDLLPGRPTPPRFLGKFYSLPSRIKNDLRRLRSTASVAFVAILLRDSDSDSHLMFKMIVVGILQICSLADNEHLPHWIKSLDARLKASFGSRNSRAWPRDAA